MLAQVRIFSVYQFLIVVDKNLTQIRLKKYIVKKVTQVISNL